MKFVLTILCSVLFLGEQMAAMSAPVVCDAQPAHQCCHGCKMPCCAASPASAPQAPVTATVSNFQPQILSPVPTVVLLVLPTSGIPSVSPVASPFLRANDAPIFARHCAWLI
jgi:hypothetical protein